VAEIKPDEMLDWLDIVATLEVALRRAFGATMFNWSCFMNHAYRESSPNPHIHWWIVPRYDRPVSRCGLTFEDANFGSPYDHSIWRSVSQEVCQDLVKKIQEAIVAGGM
jgi:diadenosine tetraphosphate (Ap4A) HIT family hydrolase